MIDDRPYKTLDWDTENFGFLTGTITRNLTSDAELREVLMKMKADGFRLVYFPSDKVIAEDSVLRDFDGILADEKLTFVKTAGEESILTTAPQIHPYTADIVSPELLDLAYDSGLYSRFRVDPHFVHNEYQLLYGIWIRRSVLHEIAHEVLVFEENAHVLGMITLGEKNRRGDIGLVAVSEKARGKGIGKHLMHAAEENFRSRGFSDIQVVTQGINKAAIHLYTGAGYALESTVYFYHFWLS